MSRSAARALVPASAPASPRDVVVATLAASVRLDGSSFGRFEVAGDSVSWECGWESRGAASGYFLRVAFDCGRGPTVVRVVEIRR